MGKKHNPADNFGKYSQKNNGGLDNPFKGRKHTAETREKMRKNSAHNKYWLGKKRGESPLMGRNNPGTSGENNHNWKGGISSQERLERVRFRRTMQKKVFERDNYTCCMCGERGKNLQVDHIQSWSEYVDMRFNMENLRTMCMDCHYEITFGRKKPKNVKSWGHNLSKITLGTT